GRVRTRYSTLAAIEEEIAGADVVIGAVLVPGASAPKLVSRDMLLRMKRGAVLVDVAIDQRGCFETSSPTTHENPTFEVDGVIHYCVANMPGAVPSASRQRVECRASPKGSPIRSTLALNQEQILRWPQMGRHRRLGSAALRSC
ncbi:hypothetical protein DTB58_39740, partial [Streptomyces griseus]|nr:hypothetical protein [Streptomyces griseus]